MKKSEILGYVLLIFLGIVGFITLCINAEQIDNKKELSSSTANVIR